MPFEISEFLAQPPGSQLSFSLSEDLKEASDPEVKFILPASGKVTLVRIEEGILANFEVVNQVRLICDRCLSPFKKEIKAIFNQRYLLDSLKPSDLNQEEDKKEGFIIDAKNKVDFREALRQGILTSLPTKRLCLKTCRGLCQICGQNLNKKECEHYKTKKLKIKRPKTNVLLLFCF